MADALVHCNAADGEQRSKTACVRGSETRHQGGGRYAVMLIDHALLVRYTAQPVGRRRPMARPAWMRWFPVFPHVLFRPHRRLPDQSGERPAGNGRPAPARFAALACEIRLASPMGRLRGSRPQPGRTAVTGQRRVPPSDGPVSLPEGAWAVRLESLSSCQAASNSVTSAGDWRGPSSWGQQPLEGRRLPDVPRHRDHDLVTQSLALTDATKRSQRLQVKEGEDAAVVPAVLLDLHAGQATGV